MDFVDANDTEFFHDGMYQEESKYSHYLTSVINGIKFRMTNSPTIYDWDRTDKVG